MTESEDKNIPLMKPTFFDKDDPNNPKYASLEEKRKTLLEKQKSFKKNKVLGFIGCLLIFFTMVPEFLFVGSLDVSQSIDYLSVFGIGAVNSIAMYAIIMGINNKKFKLLDEIEKLEEKIDIEETELSRAKVKEFVNEKLKSLSKKDKQALDAINKSETILNAKEAFAMSFEEFLELYEKSNGFEDEEQIDKATENLRFIETDECEKEESKIIKKDKNNKLKK